MATRALTQCLSSSRGSHIPHLAPPPLFFSLPTAALLRGLSPLSSSLLLLEAAFQWPCEPDS